jgi:hypothetical protein
MDKFDGPELLSSKPTFTDVTPAAGPLLVLSKGLRDDNLPV